MSTDVFFAADQPAPTRREVLERFREHVTRELANDVRLSRMTRHILGLSAGQPGARAFRRHLSENAPHAGAGIEVYDQAMALVDTGQALRPQAAE